MTIPKEVTLGEYRFLYDRGASLSTMGAERRAEARDLCFQALLATPVPPGWQGFIVEVSTSSLYVSERPQLVLGAWVRRVCAEAGNVETGREEGVFEEEQLTAQRTIYTDPRLDIEVMAVARSTHFAAPDAAWLSERHDALRYHQHKRSPRMGKQVRVRREPGAISEQIGGTFTTQGTRFPVSTTLTGTPLHSHMVVRLLIHNTYPRAIARSHLPIRDGDETHQREWLCQRRGDVCYDVLFRPGNGYVSLVGR